MQILCIPVWQQQASVESVRNTQRIPGTCLWMSTQLSALIYTSKTNDSVLSSSDLAGLKSNFTLESVLKRGRKITGKVCFC